RRVASRSCPRRAKAGRSKSPISSLTSVSISLFMLGNFSSESSTTALSRKIEGPVHDLGLVIQDLHFSQSGRSSRQVTFRYRAAWAACPVCSSCACNARADAGGLVSSCARPTHWQLTWLPLPAALRSRPPHAPSTGRRGNHQRRARGVRAQPDLI